MSRSYARALPARWRNLARVFTALGDERRQRILLMFRRGEELTLKEVVDAVPLSRTAVAHHVAVLRAAGVLRAERRGKEVFLRPDPETVVSAMDAVRDYIREEL